MYHRLPNKITLSDAIHSPYTHTLETGCLHTIYVLMKLFWGMMHFIVYRCTLEKLPIHVPRCPNKITLSNVIHRPGFWSHNVTVLTYNDQLNRIDQETKGKVWWWQWMSCDKRQIKTHVSSVIVAGFFSVSKWIFMINYLFTETSGQQNHITELSFPILPWQLSLAC